MELDVDLAEVSPIGQHKTFEHDPGVYARHRSHFAERGSHSAHASSNDFYDWRHSTNIEQDVQTYLGAFKKADANYNADNEPAAISSWRGDVGTV